MTAADRRPTRAGRPKGAERPTAVRLPVRGLLVLAAVSLLGMVMFGWPLLASPDSEIAHSADAPILFAIVLGMLVFVLLGEVSRGGIDAKALAVLGVLSAVAAALRPFGAGVSGFQPMFIVLLIGGRVLGPGFGFALGLVSMLGSALLTGAVGPWLPFQMLAAAWFGMGAGLLPQLRGRAEMILMAGYGAVAGIMYGIAMNLWFWPFLTSVDSGLGFDPSDPLTDNLTRFLAFSVLTGLGYDIPRSIGIIVLLLLMGGPLLRSLRRTVRRAHFDATPTFTDRAAHPPGRPSDQPAGHDSGGGPGQPPDRPRHGHTEAPAG